MFKKIALSTFLLFSVNLFNLSAMERNIDSIPKLFQNTMRYLFNSKTKSIHAAKPIAVICYYLNENIVINSPLEPDYSYQIGLKLEKTLIDENLIKIRLQSFPSIWNLGWDPVKDGQNDQEIFANNGQEYLDAILPKSIMIIDSLKNGWQAFSQKKLILSNDPRREWVHLIKNKSLKNEVLLITSIAEYFGLKEKVICKEGKSINCSTHQIINELLYLRIKKDSLDKFRTVFKF